MRNSTLIATTVVALLSAAPVLAQDSNAPVSPPAAAKSDCTIDKAMICTAKGCDPTNSLGDLPMPARVLVDHGGRIIATVGPNGLPHVSPIGGQVSTGNTRVVQGVDGLTGWMLHTSSVAPDATFVVSSNHTVLSAFGNCKPIK